MDWTALVISLKLGVCTTLALLLIGIPLAYWLSHTRSRVKFLVVTITTLPLVLPPTVLGFYLLYFMSPVSGPGRFYGWLTDSNLAFTFGGLVIASVVFNLPFSVRPFLVAFESVDSQLIEASIGLQLSRTQMWQYVILPQSWRGIVAGMVLTFAHCLGEFGVVLMVGGNIPGVTRTLSLALYDEVQTQNYTAAFQTSVFLLFASAVALILAQFLAAGPNRTRSLMRDRGARETVP